MFHTIFDTETSDLIHNSLQPLHKQPKVVEFFALMLDDRDWSEVGFLHSYIDPGQPISPMTTKITGITQDMITGQPKIQQFFPEAKEFIERSDVIIAHNLSYDMAVMDFEAQRCDGKIIWPRRKVCTVEATESMKGFRLNLTALHTELFGEGFAKAHSAENDVRATARCYVELKKRGEI